MAFDPALDALLLALREAKLGVGVAETLRLKQWLSLEPALDLRRLGRLVACMAVRSKADREVFDRIYRAWLEQVELQARTAADLAALPAATEPVLLPPGPTGDVAIETGREMRPLAPPPPVAPVIAGKPADAPNANRRRIRTGILAIGILGAVIVGAFGVPRLIHPPQFPTQDGAPDAAAGPELPDAGLSNLDASLSSLDAAPERPDSAAPDAKPDAEPPDATHEPEIDEEPALPIPDTRTFRALVPEFTVTAAEPAPLLASRWLRAAFAVVAMVIAVALWIGLRKRSWLRPPDTPEVLPGPPDIPLSPPALRGPVLLGTGDREALVWGIGRFVTDQRTTRLDVSRSVRATAAAGGIPTLRFHFEGQYRRVWLWVDEGAGDPMLSRLAAEIESVLLQSGLPVERATFWGIPDKLFTAEGDPFAATELDERRGSAVVALLTDGRRLSIHYDAPERRLRIEALLRALSHWPKLAFVDFADGRCGLDAIAGAHDIPVIRPEGIAEYLTEGIAISPGAEPAPMELAGDALAWAAACALAPRPIDEATAIALQKALHLQVTPWTLRTLHRESAAAGGWLHWNQSKRAQWLRWLRSTDGDVGVDDENPVPAGSLLGQALQFWRDLYAAEDAKRSKEENDGGAAWKNTPAEHRWRIERALLDLWDRPDEAVQVLYDLSKTDEGEIIRQGMQGYTSLEYEFARGAQGMIVLPWRRDKRPPAVRVMLQELGFGAALAPDRREALRRPGRLGLAIGLAGGLAVAAAVLAVTDVFKRLAPATCTLAVQDEAAWCQVAAYEDGRDYYVTAGRGRYWYGTTVNPGTRVSVSFKEEQGKCESLLSDGTILLCGRLQEPRVPDRAAWPFRRSVALIQASPDSPDARKLAARMLDTGSIWQVVIAEKIGRIQFAGIPGLGSTREGDQMIVISPDREVLNADMVQEFQGNLALLVERDLKRAAALLWGDGVAPLTAVWPKAEMIRGSVQTAAAPACPEGMVLIPGGTFMMGSPEGKGNEDEHPQHKVKLTPYCMDKTEVTVAQYRTCTETPRNGLQCTAAGKLSSSGDTFCNWGENNRDNHPINCVDWKQARTYCRWAGGGLPTEAQWEFAARGLDGREYPWGNEPPGPTRLNACGVECIATHPDQPSNGSRWTAMYFESDGWPETAPVGSYEAGASPFGVLDMAGNVWEWTAGWYGVYNESADPPPEDPTGAQKKAEQDRRNVVRGGGWAYGDPKRFRTARRTANPVTDRDVNVGFRCAHGPNQ